MYNFDICVKTPHECLIIILYKKNYYKTFWFKMQSQEVNRVLPLKLCDLTLTIIFFIWLKVHKVQLSRVCKMCQYSFYSTKKKPTKCSTCILYTLLMKDKSHKNKLVFFIVNELKQLNSQRHWFCKSIHIRKFFFLILVPPVY